MPLADMKSCYGHCALKDYGNLGSWSNETVARRLDLTSQVLGLQACHYTVVWESVIQTPILILGWRALYGLSHVPHPRALEFS